MPRGVAAGRWLILLSSVLLPACSTVEKSRRGALLPDEAIEALRDGVTTQADVARSFGPPVVVARREGLVRVRHSDQPRLGDVEMPGLSCFGPLASRPEEPGDVLHLYRAAVVWERSDFDFNSHCKICLPVVTRSSNLETSRDELYLLFDEATGLLRAHAHLRDGRPLPPRRDASDPAQASQGGTP